MSGIYRWNLNPFIALFFLFSSRKLAERLKGPKKVSWYKGRHTKSTIGASIAKKRTGLGRRVLRHKLAQGCAFLCIMTCFSCAALVFRYSKRARTFFTKYVPSRSFGGHVTCRRARSQCVVAYSCSYVLLMRGMTRIDRASRFTFHLIFWVHYFWH